MTPADKDLRPPADGSSIPAMQVNASPHMIIRQLRVAGCTLWLGRSHLVASVLLSVLLHALVLIAFRVAPAHVNVSESKPMLPLELTLRPYRSHATSMEDVQAEAKRAAKPHAGEKITRKPDASVEPSSVRSDIVMPRAQEETPPGSGNEGSAYPSIDWEAARRIARETDRTRARSLSELPALGSPEAESGTVLGRGIAKAARPDCRTAHAGMGLLTIAFLLRDAITDNGCKW
jgi:hypothetical protein